MKQEKFKKQNNKHILYENKKKFADGIAEDISIYITDISKYFSDNINAYQLNRDKNIYEQRLKEKRESIKEKYDTQSNCVESVTGCKSLEYEIKKLKFECSEIENQIKNIENQMLNNMPNRAIAINKLFLLKIKLQQIDSANKIIKNLNTYISFQPISI